MSKIYWTTRSGEKIDVDDMSITHLRNTLKMIIRNNSQAEAKPEPFTLSGDMANEFNRMQQEGYDEDHNLCNASIFDTY